MEFRPEESTVGRPTEHRQRGEANEPQCRAERCSSAIPSVASEEQRRKPDDPHDVAYETFGQAHEHERELAQAVDEATTLEEISPVYYKVAIALLGLLLIVITGLWWGYSENGEKRRNHRATGAR